jgi:ethanolamine permease
MGYPLFPAIALSLAVISLLTMIYYNQALALVFAVLMAVGYIYFSLTKGQRDTATDR